MPIGQGLAVTPIQMAAAYSALANHGVMARPHVVKGENAPRRREIVLGAVGQAGDDAEHVAAPERDLEQRADLDAVGPQVVERPAQNAGRHDRLDLGH
jgi:membrane carboxypeptidase/penicillin-binding protein